MTEKILDDWSLKEREGDIHRELSYSSIDIEILRKKLIDDLDYFFQRVDVDATDKEIKILAEIINKRFGVREE
jgi:hypothetical protein